MVSISVYKKPYNSRSKGLEEGQCYCFKRKPAIVDSLQCSCFPKKVEILYDRVFQTPALFLCFFFCFPSVIEVKERVVGLFISLLFPFHPLHNEYYIDRKKVNLWSNIGHKIFFSYNYKAKK